MRERLVGLGHAGAYPRLRLTALPVLLAASMISAARRSVMVRSPRLRENVHQPAQGQRLTALRANLDGHLIGGTADAAGLDLQRQA